MTDPTHLTKAMIARGGPVTAAADGRHVFATYFDGVRLCDPATGAVVRTFTPPAPYTCWRAASSPDGRLVAAGFGDLTLRVWDFDTAAERHRLPGHTGIVTAVAFAADGRRLLSGCPGDKSLRLYDAVDGRQLWAVETKNVVSWDCDLSADATVAVSCGRSPAAGVHVWDATTGTAAADLFGHAGRVTAVRLSPAGNECLSASSDGTARIWSLAAGAVRLVLDGHRKSVIACGYSPDGSLAITGGTDRTARVWNTGTGEERAVVRGFDAAVTSVGFFPGGGRAFAASEYGLLKTWAAGPA